MAAKLDPPKVRIETEHLDLFTNADQPKNSSALRVNYLGKASVDRRYTVLLIQWVVREISQTRRSDRRTVKLFFSNDGLQLENADSSKDDASVIFKFDSILKLLRLKDQDRLLAFITVGKTEADQCFCHAFQCDDNDTKINLLQNLKTRIMEVQSKANQESPPHKQLTAAQSPMKGSHRRNLSYGGPVPQTQDDAVHRFSVFYVGKVTISQSRAPPRFVDEMLRKIRLLESKNDDRGRLKKNASRNKSVEKLVDENSSQENQSRMHRSDESLEKRFRSASDGDKRPPFGPMSDQKNEICNNGIQNGNDKTTKHRVVDFQEDISIRVVTFQVSKSSLMLFSAGNRQLLLEKKIREISYCTKGEQRADHFGFICREKSSHVLYLFQGESEPMVDVIMKGMKQAFNDALQASAHLSLCETCPIQHLSRLLTKFEGASLSEQQAALQEHLQQLSETEYTFIMNKFNANTPEQDSDKIALVVYLLRAVYDQRQKIHKHNIQGMGINIANQVHTLEERERSRSTFFEKAKKSFTSSIDSLMLRRQRAKTCAPNEMSLSVDTAITSKLTSDTKRCLSPNLPRSSSEEHVTERQRSRTFHSCPPTPDYQNANKAGFVIPESDAESKSQNENQGEDENAEQFKAKKRSVTRQGSWRQHIYNTVTSDVTINKEKKEDEISLDPSVLARARWQKAIQEQIILIRMEKENKNLAAKISATETRRQKLNYEVFCSCDAETAKVWDDLLAKNWKEKIDDNILLAAIKSGVPKYRRGEIWRFLVQQHSIRAPKKDDCWKNSYKDLVDQPTSHQHAILIDLGRTFPSHMYFNSQLGAGQISLFNVLKSYSLLDAEVGYCQGLSFVAGLLIMHMAEEDAFESFRYEMYNLGIRNQYKPDMNAVQQQLYQLSRLLHDFHPNIYEHFNIHDVTPTLYAAPWFLTLFASQYPIGFAVRVMDLVFLQGIEIVFKIALALFANNSAEILECDGFESIIEYMKTGLPEKVRSQSEELISQALDMDIKHQLNLFEVEYQLLHEEMIDIRQNRERYEKLESANRELTENLNDLKCELSYAKETADALRKELAESRDVYGRNMESLNHTNNDLRLRIKELEMELRSLKIDSKVNGKSCEASSETILSPASSEVNEIMQNSVEKKDSTDGQVTMEKSWELVPSPTTINREMTNMTDNSEGIFFSSMHGENSVIDVSVNGNAKHIDLANCKSSSSDSCDSMDFVKFPSTHVMGSDCGDVNVSPTSQDATINSESHEGRSSSTKKRPALPSIETEGLLATCKDIQS